LHREARVSSHADVVDVLAILPWLRARELPDGRRFCFDLFHRRRLYRVEAVVGPVEPVDSPLGQRRARRIDARVLRSAGRDARELAIWLSDDDDRVPLRARTSEGVGDVELRLVRFERGGRMPAPPSPSTPSSSTPSPNTPSPSTPSPSTPSPP
jgi:hypothetical protein